MKRYLPLVLFLLAGCGSDDKDTTAPQISLIGANPLEVSYGTTFNDPGANASDNKDSNVNVSTTSNVQSGVIGNYSITYTATDAAGNTSSITRDVNIVDDIAPVIQLVADENIDVEVNSLFVDFGASAIDEIDGDVSVEVESNVNSSEPGTYSVVYTATDSANNSSQIIRNVRVTPPQVTLAVSIFGEGNITTDANTDIQCNDSRNCAITVDKGSEITLVAEAGTEYEFNYWSECQLSNVESCTITVDSDKLVHLGFKSTQALQTKDDVIVFTEEQIRTIVDYDSLTGLVTLQAGADIEELDIGTIIISTGIYTAPEESDNVEIYFARRIEKISVLGQSSILIDTAEVALDEFIAQGDLSYSQALTANDIEPESLSPEVSINYTKLNELSALRGAEKLDVIPFAIDVVIDDNLKVVGTVDVNIDPDINMSFSLLRGLKELKIASDIDLVSTLAVQVGAEIERERSVPIGRAIKFAPIVIGPVVFIPELQFSLKYKASASASLSPNVSLTANLSAGAHYLKSVGWTRIKSFNLDAQGNLGLEDFDVALDVHAGPEVDLGVLLYGAVGPKVSAAGVAGLNAAPVIPMSEGCSFDLSTYLGFESKFKGVFKLISKEFKYEATLFNTKYVVSSTAKECEIDRPEAPEPIVLSDVSPNSVVLTWNTENQNSSVLYSVFQDYQLIQSDLSQDGLFIEGLEPETEYCFFVVSVNTDEEGQASEPSNAECVTTLSEEEFSVTVPSNLFSEGQSTTSIFVDWDDNRETETFDYVLYQLVDGIPFALERTDIASGYALGLQPDTEYCFAVSMVDSSGNESDLSESTCATTFPAEFADWTIFIGCQGREYLIEESLDLDEDISSVISVVGNANDYNGTPLIYSLSGLYNNESSMLDGRIVWTFENNSRRRVDEFLTDLGPGDTGDVNMNQVEVTGCDAMIRFVKDEEDAESIRPHFINSNSSGNLLED